MFRFPFCAVTIMLIRVFESGGPRVMVRACPELMLEGCPLFTIRLMLALELDGRVGRTVTLVTVLATFTE
ncbi:hypothetical protein YTPLAS72_07490 [Nitrospira sp.]|nr:hypothetical protein YTPLAS72_07490 [Nitrospira sp.]